MDFCGIQKISLVDFDTELTCTLFAKGCNLRCPFCHNFELVLYDKEKETSIPFIEILSYLEEKKKFLTAVCITGGEPTLMPDLADKIKAIKSLGYKVKLDTNGIMPDVMIDLINRHLIDYVAVDIKNSKELYAKTTGVMSLDLSGITRTVEYLINHDFPYEFRTTIVDEFHSDYSIEMMGKWLNGAKVIFLQHFELSSNVPDQSLHAVPTKNALVFRRILEKYIQKVELRGF